MCQIKVQQTAMEMQLTPPFSSSLKNLGAAPGEGHGQHLQREPVPLSEVTEVDEVRIPSPHSTFFLFLSQMDLAAGLGQGLGGDHEERAGGSGRLRDELEPQASPGLCLVPVVPQGPRMGRHLHSFPKR